MSEKNSEKNRKYWQTINPIERSERLRKVAISKHYKMSIEEKLIQSKKMLAGKYNRKPKI